VLFASRQVPARDLSELIAWLKVNPGKASAGIASIERRLVAALFQKETGTQFALVPYRGTAPAMQDLVAGQIDLLIDTAIQLPLVRAGCIKAYAVTSDTRMPLAPDIHAKAPTVHRGFVRKMKPVPKSLRKSLTYDRSDRSWWSSPRSTRPRQGDPSTAGRAGSA
jgi:hypothetical protein